ncbi:hypothetical protein FA09DRAFT_216731 [Tilletiopsis washingtonensis]|uniref:Uncharacterized protein n=1 Tax=Tilletiopsis washingtonensis TaxID=58919 RepID=A0A316ZHG9_9BASI|nr:hypothetical protein FA09DRAFT_216731 [Tilletiopsis washingtonensis]PWN99723.1 hypothetical protein FA09DRAFT_216731 [Tilletiopsis washingtonensis]
MPCSAKPGRCWGVRPLGRRRGCPERSSKAEKRCRQRAGRERLHRVKSMEAPSCSTGLLAQHLAQVRGSGRLQHADAGCRLPECVQTCRCSVSDSDSVRGRLKRCSSTKNVADAPQGRKTGCESQPLPVRLGADWMSAALARSSVLRERRWDGVIWR